MKGKFVFSMLVGFQQQDTKWVIVAQTLNLTANRELHKFDEGYGIYIWEARASHDDTIILPMEVIGKELIEDAFFLNEEGV
mmetsp:Transcript_1242/g.2083  ORF Transcript_1242/g.2083 Transcript_1242/m.2083 type:complete len:81 (-) Transcript_1242:9-251(-)